MRDGERQRREEYKRAKNEHDDLNGGIILDTTEWNNECRYRIAPRANYSRHNVGTRDVNIASEVMAREKKSR